MDKYEVLWVVGEGMYGIVLKCRKKDTNEIVAIKKFKECDEDEVTKKTTMREVKILRMLKDHPNIVSLLEVFRRKGKLVLVFEYVEKNLLEVIEDFPTGIGPELVRRYMYQLCRAIHHCHIHDIVHRDIKPENLLVNSDHSLRLCDFGFARTIDLKTPSNLTDYVATRWYRAPELLLGSTDYSKAVDIWALGCIMAELASGQPLFPGETEVDQLYIIQQVLGPLTAQQHNLFLQNPTFFGLQFPDMSRPETLNSKFAGKIAKLALAFLNDVMRMDPFDRLSSKECLEHPYFDGMAKIYNEQESVTSHTASSMKSARYEHNASFSKEADRNKQRPPKENEEETEEESKLGMDRKDTFYKENSTKSRSDSSSRKHKQISDSSNGGTKNTPPPTQSSKSNPSALAHDGRGALPLNLKKKTKSKKTNSTHLVASKEEVEYGLENNPYGDDADFYQMEEKKKSNYHTTNLYGVKHSSNDVKQSDDTSPPNVGKGSIKSWSGKPHFAEEKHGGGLPTYPLKKPLPQVASHSKHDETRVHSKQNNYQQQQKQLKTFQHHGKKPSLNASFTHGSDALEDDSEMMTFKESQFYVASIPTFKK